MKKVVLSENELINIVQSIVKTLKEEEEIDFSTDVERVSLDPREKDIKKMFGGYKQYVPGDVLRHLRKNPRQVFKALYDIYGDKAYEYLDIASKKG